MDHAEIAFETLYSDYIKRMTAFVSTFRFLGEAEIEDLAHDIIVHAWFKKDRYDGTRSFNAWVYALARNYVIDYLRSRKIVSVPLDERMRGKDDTIGDTGLRADKGQSEDRELVELIKKEISSMDARDRQIAMMVFFEHMSGADASRIMGIPGSTVRWRLAAIRKKLQKICREAR